MTRRPPADPIWRELFAGDSFLSPKSSRVLVSIAATLADEGYAYEVTEGPRGHRIVRCLKSPLVTAQDGLDMMLGRDGG